MAHGPTDPSSNGDYRADLPDAPPVVIRAENLSYTINDTPILRNISADFVPGELVALMGPSGAGKTTLLKVLSGRFQKHVSGGRIEVNGRPLRECEAKFRMESNMVPQEDTLLESLTPRETLAYAVELHRPPQLAAAAAALHERSRSRSRLWSGHRGDAVGAVVAVLLRRLRLGSCADVRVEGISGGQRKRVSIALELIKNPGCMFVDEPTSGLDSVSALDVVNVLADLAHSGGGRTVVCTIHQPSLEAFRAFDRLLLLSRGAVAYHGRTSDVGTYFAAIGYPVPSGQNATDFVMATLEKNNDTGSDRKDGRGSSGSCSSEGSSGSSSSSTLSLDSGYESSSSLGGFEEVDLEAGTPSAAAAAAVGGGGGGGVTRLTTVWAQQRREAAAVEKEKKKAETTATAAASGLLGRLHQYGQYVVHQRRRRSSSGSGSRKPALPPVGEDTAITYDEKSAPGPATATGTTTTAAAAAGVSVVANASASVGADADGSVSSEAGLMDLRERESVWKMFRRRSTLDAIVSGTDSGTDSERESGKSTGSESSTTAPDGHRSSTSSSTTAAATFSYGAGPFTQLAVLVRRSLLLTHRDFAQSWGCLLSNVMLGLLLGGAYYQLDNTQARLRDRASLLFMVMMVHVSVPLTQTIIRMPTERAFVAREVGNGAYPLLPWYLARVGVSVAVQVACSTAFAVIVYHMVGLGHHHGADAFAAAGYFGADGRAWAPPGVCADDGARMAALSGGTFPSCAGAGDAGASGASGCANTAYGAQVRDACCATCVAAATSAASAASAASLSGPMSLVAFLAVGWVSAAVGTMLGFDFGAAVTTATSAITLLAPIVFPLELFSGFLVSPENIPVYFKWLYKLSFFGYSYKALVANAVGGLVLQPCPSALAAKGQCPAFGPTTPEQAARPIGAAELAAAGFPGEFEHNMWILVGFFAALFVAGYAIVRVRLRSKSH